MSIECGICEQDARAGHADDCPKSAKNKTDVPVQKKDFMTIPDQPTHALYAVDNWDGEGDTHFVFAVEVDGVMYHCENGKPVLQYVGDRIIKQWPLA